MKSRFPFSVCVLILLVPCFNPIVRSAPLAEFTGTSNNGLAIGKLYSQAQRFTLYASADIEEIQLNISSWSIDPGFSQFFVELRPDVVKAGQSEPSSASLVSMAIPISDIPGTLSWIGFRPSSPVHVEPGNYWIVMWSDTDDPEVTVSLMGVPDNPYGAFSDTRFSPDHGVTWPVIQGMDANFKVFGSSEDMTTNTTLTVSPSTVARSGTVNVHVDVKDSYSQPVPFGTQVILTADKGSLGSTTLDLLDGQASTTWTAPGGEATTATITAYFQPFYYGDYYYLQSQQARQVSTYVDNTATVTGIGINPNPATTHSSVTVTANVTAGGANVNGGSVTFETDWSDSGVFSPNPAPVVNGSAVTSWSPPNVSRNFAISGNFSGYDPGSGGIVYQASKGNGSVQVNYLNVPVNVILNASPDEPYLNGPVFLRVTVKEQASNLLVTKGFASFACMWGTFDAIKVPISGGRAYATWSAPSSPTTTQISASFDPFVDNGYRYHAPSPASVTVTVVSDPDGNTLKCSGHFVTDYPGEEDDLLYTGDCIDGFLNFLDALPYVEKGHRHGNSGASPNHYESEGYLYSGSNQSHVDAHDIDLYNGHGSPDSLWLYNSGSLFADNDFYWWEALNALGNKDVEWLGFKCCLTMSHATGWTGVFNGLHQILGFETVAKGARKWGGLWADLMTQQGYYDEPHTVAQAWLITADMTQTDEQTMRVIAPSDANLNEYFWGNGHVAGDTAMGLTYKYFSRGRRKNSSPVAGCPVLVNAVAGVEFTLDGSTSTDPDTNEYLTLVWDMDQTVNTDPYDYDNNGVDGPADDGDISGVYPKYVYDTAGNYQGRLMVIDSHGNVGTKSFWVSVAAPSPKTERAVASIQQENPIRIEVPPHLLPTEMGMYRYAVISQQISEQQVHIVMNYYGISGEPFGMDSVGNWVATSGNRIFHLNGISGGLYYADRMNLYRGSAISPPAVLPDPQVKNIADNYLGAFGMAGPIPPQEIVFKEVQDVLYGSRETGRPLFGQIQQFPINQVAVYNRQIPSMFPPQMQEQMYPVVGPGGKIHVFLDAGGDCQGVCKVWREVIPNGIVNLMGASEALDRLQTLGPKALRKPVEMPNWKNILVEGVSLGYFEDDFMTGQKELDPVYILDARIVDASGVIQTTLYLPATNLFLDVEILEPPEGAYFGQGEDVFLSASAQGGFHPYGFRWVSDNDGELGTGDSLYTNSLTVSRDDDGLILAHSILVEATDNEGRTGFAIRMIVISDLFDVTGASAEPGDSQVSLSWENPEDPEFASIRIKRRTDGPPSSPEDGDTVYEGTGEACVDGGCPNGITHYYRIFCADDVGNFSAGVPLEAIPGTVPTETPTPPPSPTPTPQPSSAQFWNFR